VPRADAGKQQHQFYALTVPGIEDLAILELTGGGARVDETLSRFDRRDSIVLFATKDASAPLGCGLLEDAFVVLFDAAVRSSPSAPKRVAEELTRERFERALRVHHAVTPKSRGRSYKVVARVAGKQAFRREELERAFVRAVGGLLPHWVATREAAALEVWVHIIGGRALAGIRISGDELAQRRYKRAHLPASLKPTVARALVLLTEPRPGDVFLDPMAGAATIARERAEAGASELILASDHDPGALQAARANAGRRVRLLRADALRLPLPDASVDAIATNPPYGRRMGEMAGLDRLYARSSREIARLLRPGGRCVVLTGEPGVWQRAMPPALRIRSKRRLLLRGLPVTAFAMVRT
jgi:23S rRNA G2445 N2-methylase RlmL